MDLVVVCHGIRRRPLRPGGSQLLQAGADWLQLLKAGRESSLLEVVSRTLGPSPPSPHPITYSLLRIYIPVTDMDQMGYERLGVLDARGLEKLVAELDQGGGL